MNNDLLSAVITTYGREFKDIEKGIASVLSQTYSPIEIIVVDDNGAGSMHQLSIENGLKAYPQVIYISHSENMGAQKSRNDGIKYSNGKWIAFLDDDDEWHESKCEKQIALFTDDVGLVYCKGYTITLGDGKSIRNNYFTHRIFKNEVSFSDMLYQDYIGTTTQVIIPRIVFDICGYFDENQPARQDYEMWIRVSEKFKCVGVDEPLFNHYKHQGEQISKSSVKSCIGYENIYTKYKESYNKHLRAKCHLLYVLFKSYKSAKLYKKAFFAAIKAIILLPLSVILKAKGE